MIQPGRLDLRADRHTPFQEALAISGIDLTGSATCHAQIRQSPDAFDLLIDLPAVGSVNTLGLLISNATVNGGSIVIYIDQATLEGVPTLADFGEPNALWWDLLITPNGGLKQKYAFGRFVIYPGVTQT